MEKPYYIPDTPLRFRLKDSDRDSNQQRFYDRLTLRGIQVIKDIDESVKEPKKWRGDHTFSPDAATYSLTHFVEPEVARAHPDWSPSQIHAEAMNRFEKRLKQDVAYEHLESQHVESTIHWKPMETREGVKVLATEYGDRMITLQELWEHTKEYASFTGTPEAYNESEHKAQLAMQEAFINGSASAFVSVLSHPDSVRYIQVWERKDDGEVVSKQVDLFLSTGKDFSHKEGDALIRNLKEYYRNKTETTVTNSESDYTHFFIQADKVEIRDIRTIARAQTYVFIREESKTLRIPQKNVLREKGETRLLLDVKKSVYDMAGFLHEHIDQTIKSFTHISSKEKKVKIETVSSVKKEGNGKDYSPMKSALSEWVITHTIIAYAPLLPMGTHATLFWFAEIPRIRKDGAPVKKNIRHPERTISPFVSRPEKNLDFVRGINVYPSYSDLQPVMVKKRVRWVYTDSNLRLRSIANRIKTWIFIGKRKLPETIRLRVKKKEEKKLREVFHVDPQSDSKRQEIMIRLGRFMDNISLFLHRKKNTILKPIEKKKHLIRREAHHAETHIAIAIFFRRVFEGVRRVSPIEKQEMKYDALKEKKEVPVYNAPPVWLLLSIIWYLTMLRESGMVSQYVPPATTTIFPPYGVIFTFAS